jgi:hypothetical protein
MPHDNKRATMAVIIIADKAVLPAMVIFKGLPKGRIVTREFSSLLNIDATRV